MRAGDVSGPERRWLPEAMLAGAAYVAIAVSFAALARSAGTREMRTAWRLAAWVAAAAVFAAHLAHEHFRRQQPPRSAAWHVSAAVAAGAFALAMWINVHARPGAPSRQSRRAPLALVVFPAVTAVPAFLAALVGASLLERASRRNWSSGTKRRH